MTTERAIELQEKAWELQAEGKLRDAIGACREAIDLIAQSEGPESADVANLLNDLAELQIEQQDFRTALASAEQAWKIEQVSPSLWIGEAPATIRIKTQTLLGNIRRTLGEYNRAERDLREALAIASTEFGPTSEASASASNEIGILYKHIGRFEDGLQLYEQALEVFVGAHGENSPQVGVIYHNLGGILFAKGDLAAAEGFARRSWEISKKQWGEEDIRTMADAVAYAAILDGLEHHTESETIYRRALGIYQTTLGTEHYEIAAVLHNIAALLAACNRCDEAEQHYRRALAIKEKLLGSDSPDVALTSNNLGRLLTDTGRPGEAVPLLTSAVTILEKSLLPEHPQRCAASENLQIALAQLRANLHPKDSSVAESASPGQS